MCQGELFLAIRRCLCGLGYPFETPHSGESLLECFNCEPRGFAINVLPLPVSVSECRCEC